MIIDDLQRSKLPFSIHFDETSTSQVKKQMDLTLRYWSPTHEKVWTVFYISLFFGHATADIVSENMYHKMCKDGIPVDRICTLVRDGPNVNTAIFRKMNELILQDFPDYPGLVDIGSCSILSMLLERVWSTMEKMLTSFAWICIHYLNIVQLEEKTSKKFK